MVDDLVVKSGKRYNTRSVLARRYGGRGKEEDTLFSAKLRKEMKKIRERKTMTDRTEQTGP